MNDETVSTSASKVFEVIDKKIESLLYNLIELTTTNDLNWIIVIRNVEIDKEYRYTCEELPDIELTYERDSDKYQLIYVNTNSEKLIYMDVIPNMEQPILPKRLAMQLIDKIEHQINGSYDLFKETEEMVKDLRKLLMK